MFTTEKYNFLRSLEGKFVLILSHKLKLMLIWAIPYFENGVKYIDVLSVITKTTSNLKSFSFI